MCIVAPRCGLTWSGISDLSSGLRCFLNSLSRCAMNSFENLWRAVNDGAYAACQQRHVLLSVLLLCGAQFETLY